MTRYEITGPVTGTLPGGAQIELLPFPTVGGTRVDVKVTVPPNESASDRGFTVCLPVGLVLAMAAFCQGSLRERARPRQDRYHVGDWVWHPLSDRRCQIAGVRRPANTDEAVYALKEDAPGRWWDEIVLRPASGFKRVPPLRASDPGDKPA